MADEQSKKELSFLHLNLCLSFCLKPHKALLLEPGYRKESCLKQWAGALGSFCTSALEVSRNRQGQKSLPSRKKEEWMGAERGEVGGRNCGERREGKNCDQAGGNLTN